MNAELRAKLNQPVLNITGDPCYDTAFWGAIKGFEAMRDNEARSPFFNAWRVNIVHMNTFRQTNGDEVSPIAVAGFYWQLKATKPLRKCSPARNAACASTHSAIRSA